MSELVPYQEQLPALAPVTPPRIRPGDKLAIHSVTYKALRKADRRVLFARVDTGVEVWLDAAELVKKFASGEARIALPSWLPAARAKKWNGDFASLPEADKRRAYIRRDYAEAMMENARLGYPRKVKQVIADVHHKRLKDPENAAEHKPSQAAVYEWKAIGESAELRRGS